MYRKERLRLFCCCLSTLLLPLFGLAQIEKKQDVVFMRYADKGRLFQQDGISYQEATGSVEIIHNNTYIRCDTAVRNLRDGTIDAKGHVRIIQDQTQLTGETIHYIERLNLAQVRGKRVELFDKKNNRLRTQYLDFNTKDSIATFYGGGSMVDSSGNVLESLTGHYFSKEKLFTFEQRVAMNTDTVRIKADSAHYKTNINTALFFGNIHAWHTDGYLRADRGEYKRDAEFFQFTRNVYVKTTKQEVWADTLNYDRKYNKGALFGHFQILDTTQSLLILGDEGHFQNQPQKVLLYRDPVLVLYNLDKDVRDSLFVRADSISYLNLPRHQVDSSEVVRSEARLRFLKPKKAAPLPDTLKQTPPKTDTLAQATRPPLLDSLPASPLADSLPATPLANTPPALDTTLTRLIYAWGNVKAYRNQAQGLCDSLVFNTIDSTARLYGKPVLWHENNQFSADSIQFFLLNNKISRADLFSSAFIIAQEDSLLYNQVKGNNMIGYFRDNDIYRFDAIGSAEVIRCIREDSLVSSLNRIECKELTITLKQRQIQRAFYRENIKSNLYPLYEVTSNDRLLSDFNWRAKERPKDRFAITSRNIRPSFADQSELTPQPDYPYTQLFFPGHIKPKEPTKPLSKTEKTTEVAAPLDLDTIPPVINILQSDTLQKIVTTDTLAILSPVISKDTIIPMPSDSLAQPVHKHQELTTTPPLSKKELRAQRRAIRKEQAAQRKAERKRLREERRQKKIATRLKT